MAQVKEVILYLDQLLEAADFPDYGPNGLQVPGSEELSLVVTGVQDYRDIWILRFAHDGRVEHFEEWAFWPDRPWTAASASS